MKETWKVYGSKEDLESLKYELKKAGFEEYFDEHITASSQQAISVGITWIITTGIGNVVKHWLSVRGKRMITRETPAEKITITGYHSPSEIEAAMAISHAFNVVPDTAEPPTNSEGEMGFHVGRKKAD